MTGLGCEIGGFSHGIGRSASIPRSAFKGKTSEQLEREFGALRLPGLEFAKVSVPDANGKPVDGGLCGGDGLGCLAAHGAEFRLMRLACKWSAAQSVRQRPGGQSRHFPEAGGIQRLVERDQQRRGEDQCRGLSRGMAQAGADLPAQSPALLALPGMRADGRRQLF